MSYLGVVAGCAGPSGQFIMARSAATDEDPGAMLVVIENWLEEVRAMVRQ